MKDFKNILQRCYIPLLSIFYYNLVPLLTMMRANQEREGMANSITVWWPPRMVERKRLKTANYFFIASLIAYASFGILSIHEMIKLRYSPPVSFIRDVHATSFKAPFWTFCRPNGTFWWDGSPFDWDVQCMTLDYTRPDDCDMKKSSSDDNTCSPMTKCLFDTYEFQTFSGDDCILLEFKNEVSFRNPAVAFSLSIKNDEQKKFYPWVTSYVSSFVPTVKTDWDVVTYPYNFDWYHLGNAYTAVITKQVTENLEVLYRGLSVSYSNTTSYRVDSVYHHEIEENSLILYFRSNSLGVDIIKEKDPVDILNLVGTIAGLYGVILIFFTNIFGNSITRNMQSAHDKRIRSIAFG